MLLNKHGLLCSLATILQSKEHKSNAGIHWERKRPLNKNLWRINSMNLINHWISGITVRTSNDNMISAQAILWLTIQIFYGNKLLESNTTSTCHNKQDHCQLKCLFSLIFSSPLFIGNSLRKIWRHYTAELHLTSTFTRQRPRLHKGDYFSLVTKCLWWKDRRDFCQCCIPNGQF